MNDLAQALDDKVSKLLDFYNDLKSHLGNTPVSSEVRDVFDGFQQNYELYIKHSETDDLEKTLQSVKHIVIYGTAIPQRLQNMKGIDDRVKNIAKSMGEAATELEQQTQNDERTFAPLSILPHSQNIQKRVAAADNLKRIEQILLEQEKHDERIKKSLAENERRLVVTEESLKDIDQKAKEALSKMNDAYLEALDQAKTKKDEIDSILGHVSGRAIAGDFEKSAASEKAAADWLRVASLFCMILIVGVLGYSFWETIQQDFQWQKSLFRVALAFLLSAPAAYLARESAKHRAQQYLHLQTALDLKAISPYLASLPQDIQHRIKGEVAAKLFGGRDFSHVGTDSYPINFQELLMELVKKLELPKISSK